ncbi:MAG: excinuclease ABC subunit UvrA [Patescibacteria group bacterium]
MEQEKIIIKGAEENNLKNVNLELPKNKIIAITGLSGSGKSSFAFDTLYFEGYRRYVENLSGSARFFMHSVKKPKVKEIQNLCPTISISQRNNNQNPRSTVGTLTGIYDFLRALYFRFGTFYCPHCGKELKKNTTQEILDKISQHSQGTEVLIASPVTIEGKGITEVLKSIENAGYSKIIPVYKDKDKKTTLLELAQAENSLGESELRELYILVDKLYLDKSRLDKERIIDSLKSAEKLSEISLTPKSHVRTSLSASKDHAGAGKMAFIFFDRKERASFSRCYVCSGCGYQRRDFVFRDFSFNSPEGACSLCKGIGEVARLNVDKVIPNQKLSFKEGAVEPWVRLGGRSGFNKFSKGKLQELANFLGFSLDDPIEKLTKEQFEAFIYGFRDDSRGIFFEGVEKDLNDRYEKADLTSSKRELEKYFSFKICPDCGGGRLKPEVLNAEVWGKKFKEMTEMEIGNLLAFLREKTGSNKKNKLKENQAKIIEEINKRLDPLVNAGVGYLSLNRGCNSLSGGELQRTRIASQLYSGLNGVLYVLDEPTIGLHSRDTQKLIKTFQKLKNNKSSLVVVEHDKEIIESADEIIDFGPGAGEQGGEVIFQGNFGELKKADTPTADFFNNKISFQSKNRKPKKHLEIQGARHNNLKNIDLKIPLGCLVSFAGVSGSGKSSLVVDVLAKALRQEIHQTGEEPGSFNEIKGLENIQKAVAVDQLSIGRSPRSNPATYTGIFSHIRELFAQTEAAEKKGFNAGYFSFNLKGGRCEHCQGEGTVSAEMPLLEDVRSLCPYCKGTRYNKKILEIEYHGVNIAKVLDMSVDYAYRFFHLNKLVQKKLKVLKDVGLGYLKLGQSANRLSGGEAQRIKLATELIRKSRGNCLYILDEPTIGLHFQDIKKLLKVLNELVDQGNSVFVIEHNTEMLKASDWIIEMGPGGGEKGGEVIFEGTPKELSATNTETGRVL